MAIDWGPYESSGGLGVRVGIDVSWGNVSHDDGHAVMTVRYYTQNIHSWDDEQALSFTGAITGSDGFNNVQGEGVTIRSTQTRWYVYGDNSYGSSPATWTVGARLTGAFNGISPSNSVNTWVPARPIAAPNDPTGAGASYVNDSNQKITWNNRDSAARPWNSIDVDVEVDDGAWNRAANLGGGANSWTDSVSGMHKRRWRVRASNNAGTSGWDYTGYLYTQPSGVASLARTNGDLSWSNSNMNYSEYDTEIQVSRNGGGSWSALTTRGSGVNSYTDPSFSAAQKTGYRLRHRTTAGGQGTLVSDWNETSFSAGATSAPAAPTNLNPTNNIVISPATARTFSWKYNTTDTTDQTRFQIQWRVIGSPTWTTVAEVVSPLPSWSAPASTFPDNSSLEWQVRTRGSDAAYSPYSASGLFKTVGDPNALRDQQYRLMRMNLQNGQPETMPAGSAAPVGSMLMFGGAAAPIGWLLCQGQAVSRATYSDLFGVVGIAFGAGDGSTTFNVPDVQSRFPMGAGTFAARAATENAAENARNTQHTHGAGEFNPSGSSGAPHDHAAGTLTTGNSNLQGTRADGTVNTPSTAHGHNITGSVASSSSTAHTHSITGQSGSGGKTGANHVVPFIGLNFIIKV
jgi:microcystin-dependent protein